MWVTFVDNASIPLNNWYLSPGIEGRFFRFRFQLNLLQGRIPLGQIAQAQYQNDKLNLFQQRPLSFKDSQLEQIYEFVKPPNFNQRSIALKPINSNGFQGEVFVSLDYWQDELPQNELNRLLDELTRSRCKGYKFQVGDGINSEFIINRSFIGSAIIQLYEPATGEYPITNIFRSQTQVRVAFALPPSTNQFELLIIEFAA